MWRPPLDVAVGRNYQRSLRIRLGNALVPSTSEPHKGAAPRGPGSDVPNAEASPVDYL